MRAPLCVLTASFVLFSFEPRARAVQCADVATFNSLTAQQATTATSVSVEFDVTGINPDDYPDGKGWLVEFANTNCWNVANNDFGALANLKVYGTQSVPGTHASGSIKDEYGVCCVTPATGCPDNWADGDFGQTIFSNPAQQCHVKAGVDATAVSYSIQCDGGTVYAGTGDNTSIGLAPNALSLLKSVGGGHPMAAGVQVSNVQVCFELAPPSVNTQSLLAVEDATIAAATPNSVVTPDTDLSCGPDDGNILLKFTVPDPAGKLKSAKVRLTASNVASAGGDGGNLFFVADNSWSEKTVTWNNAPKPVGSALGQILGVVAGSAYSVDVTSTITGKGTYSFELAALTSGGTDGSHFLSKEASTTSGPSLVLEWDLTDGGAGSGGAAGGGVNDAGLGGSGGVGGLLDASVGGSGAGNPAQGGVDPAASDSGCGCSLPRPASTTAAWLGAALALSLLVRRRRR